MALREIDEGVLSTLQAGKGFIDKALATPATRKRFLEIFKELNPDTAIPELDAAKPVVDEVAAVSKRVDDFITEQKKEREDSARAQAKSKIEDEIRQGRKYLKDQGLTDEGVGKVEELMQARGIGDYEAGYLLFMRTQPKAEETLLPAEYGRSWDFSRPDTTDEDHKMLVNQNYRQFVNKKVNETLKEVRGGKGGTIGRSMFGQ